MVPTRSRPQGGTVPRLLRLSMLAVLACVVASCTSARPPLPNKPQARDLMRRQGAAMIDSLVAAHGGMENWNKVVEMTFRGKDEWKAPMDRVLNPWPVESVSGENRFRVHENLGRIQFVTDRGTLTYGIGKTGPWALLRGEISPDVKDERNASYVVAWHNFLAGVPFRFKEYGAVAHYLGRAHRVYQNQSVEFEEVLVTYPPEGDVWPDDWFVVRIDPTTHELRTMTYTTVNRSSKLFETTCEFSSPVVIEGLKISTRRVCTLSSPIERELHTWELADVRFNQVSPDDYFERRSGGLPAPVDTAVAGRLDSAAVAGRPDTARTAR